MYKLIFLLMIFSASVFGQTEYPCFKTDSVGQKLVIMTIEQAQSLDNNTDLIPLFEKMTGQISQVDSSCIKTIEDKDRIIDSQSKQVKSQKDLLDNKKIEIENINLQLLNCKATEDTYKKELENKNKEIDLHLGQINKLKGRIFVGGGIGVIVGLVVGLLVSP
jgi:hypothetical protein